MNELGKLIFLLGVVLAGLGLVLWKLGGKFPIGRLPGDISIEKSGFSFYFPITTCILLSLLITAIFWLLKK